MQELKTALPWFKIATLPLLLLNLANSTGAYADPPRILSTNFADYARQQAQHDQLLMQKASTAAVRQPSASPVPALKSDATSVSNSRVNTSTASKKSSTPIDINTADEAALSTTLLGVGPAKARAIVAYRQANGAFRQVDDLLAVKGIGAATLQKNRDRIRISPVP